MKEINYLIGDATNHQYHGLKFIVHCCNDSGLWGSGFVLAVLKRLSKPEQEYRDWFTHRNKIDENENQFLRNLKLKFQYIC